jgi:hypothetical protein
VEFLYLSNLPVAQRDIDALVLSHDHNHNAANRECGPKDTSYANNLVTAHGYLESEVPVRMCKGSSGLGKI